MAPMRHAEREQRRGLAVDRGEVGVLGAVDVVGVAELGTSPSHSRPMVAASRPATSVPSDAAISEARASRKSPTGWPGGCPTGR